MIFHSFLYVYQRVNFSPKPIGHGFSCYVLQAPKSLPALSLGDIISLTGRGAQNVSDCLLSTGSVDDWELTIAYSNFVEHIDGPGIVTNPLMIKQIQP